MKYEYKVVEITWNGKHGVIEDTLNEFGAQGWRAAEFRWHSGSHEWVHVLFERMLAPPLMRASPTLSTFEQVGKFFPINEGGWSDETQYHPVDSSDA